MDTDDVEVTEIIELNASKVSGVSRPANGTPFMVIKAAAADDGDDDEKDGEDEKDGDWWDKNKSDVTKKSDSQEADAQQEEMTEESAKSSSAEADAQQEEMTEEGAEKGAVQEGLHGTTKPEEAGHLDTGQSGVSGPVVTGTHALATDSSHALGGATTSNVPDIAQVDYDSPIPKSTDGAGVFGGQTVTIAKSIASLVDAIGSLEEGRQAVKDGKYLQVTNPTSGVDPGSAPWESYDSATLAQVAQCLAGCCNALDAIQQREAIEAASGNLGDYKDTWDLEEAATALDYAMGVAARLAFSEAADSSEVTKAYRRLTVSDTGALRQARDHLIAVVDGAEKHSAANAGPDNEEILTMDVTKSELAEAIAAGVTAAMKVERKQDKKARKQKEAEEAEAAKGNISPGTTTGGTQSNNAGEVSESDVKPTKETKSDDVNAVKDEGEDGEASKEETETTESPITKQVEDKLEALTKGLASVEELVSKIAKRPRPGGPSLDGQARGAVPAAEGRQSDVTKGEGDEIETLTKQLDEATDPMQKSELGLRLTRARLTQAHEQGRL